MQCDHCQREQGHALGGFRGTYCSDTCRARHEPLFYKFDTMNLQTAQLLAYDLYCLVTHKDCPQWVRDSSEAIFNDLTK